MAGFICGCEGKSYGGWFNKRTCKDCNEIIHFHKPVLKGGNQWRNQRIEDLEYKILFICDIFKLSDDLNKIRDKLISWSDEARKDIADNQYKRT